MQAPQAAICKLLSGGRSAGSSGSKRQILNSAQPDSDTSSGVTHTGRSVVSFDGGFEVTDPQQAVGKVAFAGLI